MQRFIFRALILFLTLSIVSVTAGRHADAAPKPLPAEGILLVAFGTSVPEAMKAFAAVHATFTAAFPDTPVVWAYTSQKIRAKLAAQGTPTGGISEGLAALAAQKVRNVRVQSLHIMAGEEFAALERAVLIDLQRNPGRFGSVFLGRPLLESDKDARELSAALRNDTTRTAEEALVLMGHGQSHGRADLVFEGTRAIFSETDPLLFMATVEGARNFDGLLSELRARKVRTVRLQPLMLVAGDHARNDLAGPEDDSWASRLRAAGFQVQADVRGLGEIAQVRDIFVRHARENVDDLVKEPKKQ